MSLSAVSVAANAEAVSYSIFAPAAPSALFAPGRALLRFRRSAAQSMRLQACAVGTARARRHGAGDSGGGAPRRPFLARRGPSGRAAVDALLTRVPYAVLCERLVPRTVSYCTGGYAPTDAADRPGPIMGLPRNSVSVNARYTKYSVEGSNRPLQLESAPLLYFWAFLCLSSFTTSAYPSCCFFADYYHSLRMQLRTSRHIHLRHQTPPQLLFAAQIAGMKSTPTEMGPEEMPSARPALQASSRLCCESPASSSQPTGMCQISLRAYQYPPGPLPRSLHCKLRLFNPTHPPTSASLHLLIHLMQRIRSSSHSCRNHRQCPPMPLTPLPPSHQAMSSNSLAESGYQTPNRWHTCACDASLKHKLHFLYDVGFGRTTPGCDVVDVPLYGCDVPRYGTAFRRNCETRSHVSSVHLRSGRFRCEADSYGSTFFSPKNKNQQVATVCKYNRNLLVSYQRVFCIFLYPNR